MSGKLGKQLVTLARQGGGSFKTVSDRSKIASRFSGNDSNLLIVFYVQIMPDDFVMQLHRF